jgi:peptidoglycan biosynthesis protein MviN/MurJ (putative lipid II flippase)
MWNSLVSLVLLPLAFLAGSYWGPAGIAAAWVMAYPLNAVPLYVRLRRRIDLSNREFFAAVWPALNGVLIMAAVVMGIKTLVAGPFPIHQGWRLALEAGSGVVVYVCTLMLFHRPRLSAFRRAFGMMKG